MENCENCIICGIFESFETRYPIYSSCTAHSGSLIKDLLRNLTKNHLPMKHRETYVCKPCFKLIEQFDFSTITITEIKNQIHEQIQKNYGIYNHVEFVDIACQTEDYLTTLQESVEEDSKEKNDCKFCGNVFRNKSGLYRHMTLKHKAIMEDQEVKQEQSDHEDFCDYESLKQPSDSEDDKPLIAIKTECDSEDESTRRGRGRPKKETDEIIVKPCIFKCTQCPKKWRTKSELRIHIASHSTVRAHVCEICGRAYKKRQALDVHVGMHNGINPFSCNVCGKVFTQKGALTRHASIHTGQANYQCDLCGKRFIHHTSFSMHALTHSGLKAFKCEVCGLGLMSTSHLKRHMRAHSGEKKFACTQCGKRFAERYNLAAHERLHFTTTDTRVKRGHVCPVCGESFLRRQKLEEHLRNNHHKIIDAEDSRKWNGSINAEVPWTAFSQSETVFSMDIKPEQLENFTDSNEMNSS